MVQLCDHLADSMKRNDLKRPTVGKKWHDECRRMLDIDGRDKVEAWDLICWVEKHTFWRGVIQSMPSLRKHYDKVLVQAREDGAVQGGRRADPEARAAFNELRERHQEMNVAGPPDGTSQEVDAWYDELNRLGGEVRRMERELG